MRQTKPDKTLQNKLAIYSIGEYYAREEDLEISP